MSSSSNRDLFDALKIELASTDEEWVDFYRYRMQDCAGSSDTHAHLLGLEVSHIYGLSDVQRQAALGKLIAGLAGVKTGKEFFGEQA